MTSLRFRASFFDRNRAGIFRSALWAVIASVLFIAAAGDVPAQEIAKDALIGKIELRYRRCRSGSPIPVVWKFDLSGRAIAKGVLNYEIYDADELLASMSLPDLVLSPGKNEFNSPGKNEFNATLPAVSVNASSSVLTVRAHFITEKQTLELDEQTLRVPRRFVQWFNVGVVTGAVTSASAEVTNLMERVRMELFLVPNNRSDSSTTTPFELRIESLPNEPLTMCNFDVLALTPAALAELHDDQAAALRRWVAAGGSLCVFAGGGLNSKHANFLNELFAEAAGNEAFVVDPRGVLATGPESTGRIHSARKGLGRVVLLTEPFVKTLPPGVDAWRTAAGFLLKVRSDKIQPPPPNPIIEQPGVPSSKAGSGQGKNPGQSSKPLTQEELRQQQQKTADLWQQQAVMMRLRQATGQQLYDPAFFIRSALAVAPPGSLDGLYQLLMPSDVQMVPLGIIAAILAAYVVTIGPIDYYLLGLVRLRRFTWVLFPLVTAGFAVFTLWLSQWYLGTNDHRRGIEIYDVVKGDVPARRTRIELLFLSGQNDVSTEVQNGLFSQIGLGVSVHQLYGSAASSSGDVLVQGPRFVDRYPSHYAISQWVPQWTPVVNRFLWIDPKPVTPKSDPAEQPPGAAAETAFDWDQLGDMATTRGREEIGERIRKSFGENAFAAVYREGNTVPIQKSMAELRPSRNALTPQNGPATADLVVRELSVRDPQFLFAVASQVAPSGGPDLEDLALLDPSDPRQSLLVIVIEKGEDLVMYRRLFVGGR